MSGATIKKIKRMYANEELKVEPHGDTYKLSRFRKHSDRYNLKFFSLCLNMGAWLPKHTREDKGTTDSVIIPLKWLYKDRRRAIQLMLGEIAPEQEVIANG